MHNVNQIHKYFYWHLHQPFGTLLVWSLEALRVREKQEEPEERIWTHPLLSHWTQNHPIWSSYNSFLYYDY